MQAPQVAAGAQPPPVSHVIVMKAVFFPLFGITLLGARQRLKNCS